jgi:hypothetical protein
MNNIIMFGDEMKNMQEVITKERKMGKGEKTKRNQRMQNATVLLQSYTEYMTHDPSKKQIMLLFF